MNRTLASLNPISAIDDGGALELMSHNKRLKYLIFSLNEIDYGIPLSEVKEVISLSPITPIPKLPDYFMGILNLRGEIISIISLRRKLGFEEIPHQKQKTCIVISEVNKLILGTLVDDVRDVQSFKASQIKQDLDISQHPLRQFIKGAATLDDDSMVILLDNQQLLDPEELGLIQTQIKQVASSQHSFSSGTSHV